MPNRALLLAALLIGAPLLTGCASAELTSVRNDLARQMPAAEIREGRTISIGPVTIGFARLVTGIVGEDFGPARAMLRHVRRVQVGRFDVGGSVDTDRVRMPARLRRYVERDGWMHLASFRQDGEAGWILYRARGERITDLFVTVLSGDELVLARVRGNLTGIAHTLLEQADVKMPFLGQLGAALDEEPWPAEESTYEIHFEAAAALEE